MHFNHFLAELVTLLALRNNIWGWDYRWMCICLFYNGSLQCQRINFCCYYCTCTRNTPNNRA